MKIKKSELKRIIAEELEESVIEEGLWDTVVGGMAQGGHGAAKNAMSIVDLAIRELQNILDVQKPTATSANTLTGGHLRRDGTLAPWDAPMDIVARAKENYHNLNPSHKERHIKILKDLIYKYPSNKKIALALTALETLDKSLIDIVAAAKADFDAGRAIDHAAAVATAKEWWARNAAANAARVVARKPAAAEPKPRGHMAALVPQRGKSYHPAKGSTTGTSYGSGGMGEGINKTDLHGIVLEELNAVLDETDLGEVRRPPQPRDPSGYEGVDPDPDLGPDAPFSAQGASTARVPLSDRDVMKRAAHKIAHPHAYPDRPPAHRVLATHRAGLDPSTTPPPLPPDVPLGPGELDPRAAFYTTKSKDTGDDEPEIDPRTPKLRQSHTGDSGQYRTRQEGLIKQMVQEELEAVIAERNK